MTRFIGTVLGLSKSAEEKELDQLLDDIRSYSESQKKNEVEFHKSRLDGDKQMLKSLIKIGEEKRKLELMQKHSEIEQKAQSKIIEATQRNLEIKKSEKRNIANTVKTWLND